MMRKFFGQMVFATPGADYCWEDVLLAARFWGDWQMLESQVRLGLACLEAVRKNQGVSPAELSAAANEFRYDRNLITAKETERWLAEWGLTNADLGDYLRRMLARQKCGHTACMPGQDSGAGDEVSELIRGEAICSGTLARLARKLAGRAAVFLHIEATTPAVVAAAEPSAARIALPADSADFWDLPRDRFLIKLRHIAVLESVFQSFRASRCTPEAIADEIGARALDWTRIDSQALVFGSEEAALEAALCLREDRQTMAAVAVAAGTRPTPARAYLQDLDDAWRVAFLSAREGELVGPLRTRTGFRLAQVVGRVSPSMSDPEARARAEASILTAAVNRAIDSRIRWGRLPE
jgi:hypothetical protein